jgi:hypothetical protein
MLETCPVLETPTPPPPPLGAAEGAAVGTGEAGAPKPAVLPKEVLPTG